ncbi:alpha/beta fold hydrolase [Flavobacterium sp.]|uniref:alpha/beta fold hydrolase n=1 Tax=Flavobacterium sp. TaxID=239 RepID=UPI0037530788
MKIRFKKRYFFYVIPVLYILFCQSCMTMRMNSKKTIAFFETTNTQFLDKTIDFDDYKIHYIETGKPENPTLFFIHGSPGSWDAYKNYLTETLLLKKYRMIAIDRPGFGYSNFGEAENLSVQANRIDNFVKKIDNNKPIILIGHSMGGPVVVKLATIKPKLYSNLIILAGSIDPEAETPEVWRSIIKTKPIRYLIPGALRPANDELWWLKQDLVDMKPNLKNITSNVVVIHGTKDPLVPFSNVAFIKRTFVNAKSMEIIPIENANHFIPWEHFETIRNVLLDLKL